MSNHLIIKNLFNNRYELNIPCNLEKIKSKLTSNNFNFDDFLENYAHNHCDLLAFWLHDNFGLKIGVIRAIDMNNENDTEYDTIVHQFAYLDNHLIVDARGIDSEKAMLRYYQEGSLFDDEDWDFIVDYDYEVKPKENSNRKYSNEEENAFNRFLSLLSAEIKNQLYPKEDSGYNA